MTYRTITEEMRAFGNRTIRVSLSYNSDQKRFNISAVEANDDDNGFTSYMLHELKFGTIPLKVNRWSAKVGEQAKGMLEEYLAPVLKQVFESKLQELKSSDFNPPMPEEDAMAGTCYLTELFVAPCDMITFPTFVDNETNHVVKGFADGRIDDRPVRLFLFLNRRDLANQVGDYAQYKYLVSVKECDLH